MSKRFAPGVNRMPSCPRGSKTTPLETGGGFRSSGNFQLVYLVQNPGQDAFPGESILHGRAHFCPGVWFSGNRGKKRSARKRSCVPNLKVAGFTQTELHPAPVQAAAVIFPIAPRAPRRSTWDGERQFLPRPRLFSAFRRSA